MHVLSTKKIKICVLFHARNRRILILCVVTIVRRVGGWLLRVVLDGRIAIATPFPEFRVLLDDQLFQLSLGEESRKMGWDPIATRNQQVTLDFEVSLSDV